MPIKISATKSWQLIPHPKLGWMLILGLYTVVFLLLAVGWGQLVILIYPLGSLAVSIFLYRRYPILYMGFTWWMWFLVGVIRRLIDYKCGYVTPWPIDLAPLLVTSVCGFTLLRYLPITWKRDGLPFIICFVCVLYGSLVGIIQQPVIELERELIVLMRWLNPIFVGFHLFVNWRFYPQYRHNIQRVFLWGVIIMAGYGIVQFLLAPEWDKFFLYSYRDANGASTWMGKPEPFGIRIWSTMSNTFTFAFNLVPGLILLLISKSKLRVPASILGYLALLLSQSRTGWYSWVIMMVLFIFTVKASNQIRLLVIILMIAAVVIPLANIEPFSEIIQSRIETFSDLESDASFNGRIAQFSQSINYALSQFFGYGLVDAGRAPAGIFSSNDNGYLVILVSLGWLAAIPYTGAIILLLSKLFFNPKNYSDMFAIASRIIALGSLIRMFTSNVTSGDYALPIWAFLGMGLASYKYYLHQNTIFSASQMISKS
ncbi:MAG: O-antigen ligase family protein [Pleurocapsa sp. SU_5_0]|nr:O-antigen ligase family protein [Pleurocapsa sp. SU_5_0]